MEATIFEQVGTLLSSPLGQTLLLLVGLGLWGILGNVVDPVTLEKGLKATFYKAYDAAMPFHPTLTTMVPSKAKDEKYGWLGTAPTMRQWTDERLPKGLLDHSYTIVNNKYEASIGVDEDSYEDDQLGQVQLRVQDMGMRARRHPDSLLTTLMVNGESTLCYDGQFFFDTDHSEGDSGSQSNDLTYDATDHTEVTQAEFDAALDQAIAAMLGFVDDRGEPFLEEWEFTPENLVCMVPPELRKVALKTLGADLISNTTNVNKNLARVMVNPRLTSAVKMYLYYVGAPIKPFIHQTRRPVRPGFLGNTSERGFMRGEFVFGIDARYNVGYGLWQYAVLTTFN